MLERFEVLHDEGYLHRDLKPEAIRIGVGKLASTVYLTDLSNVKRYVCPNTGAHHKHVPDCGVHGNRRYLSLNAHVGNQLSRADDLIALGHVFVSLLKKNWLPWDITPLPEFHDDWKDPNYFVVLKKR
jgi:serine/threonine protein kinase